MDNNGTEARRRRMRRPHFELPSSFFSAESPNLIPPLPNANAPGLLTLLKASPFPEGVELCPKENPGDAPPKGNLAGAFVPPAAVPVLTAPKPKELFGLLLLGLELALADPKLNAGAGAELLVLPTLPLPKAGAEADADGLLADPKAGAWVCAGFSVAAAFPSFFASSFAPAGFPAKFQPPLGSVNLGAFSGTAGEFDEEEGLCIATDFPPKLKDVPEATLGAPLVALVEGEDVLADDERFCGLGAEADGEANEVGLKDVAEGERPLCG